MNHSRANIEFNLVHDRVDIAANAITKLTNYLNEERFKMRAMENLINRSWLLRRILGVKKMNIEISRLVEEELLAKASAEKVLEKQAELKIKVESQKKENTKTEKAAVKTTKNRLRKIRKLEKPHGKR